MKYYLVALLDKNSNFYMENLQKQVCRKYKLYKNHPALHITVEVIDEPNLDVLDSVISDIIKPYKRFKVELNNAICFDSPYKSITMKVTNKGYITRLSRRLNEKLRFHGFKVRENNEILHIALGNTNYSSKKSINEHISINPNEKFTEDPGKMVKIERFELWKAINNRKSLLIKSYPLKEY